MPLLLPAANFRTWKKQSVEFYYFANHPTQDADNHVHVRVTNAAQEPMEVAFVSIKIGGKSTKLSPSSAVTLFKFKPHTATWPPDPIKTRYLNALKAAGLIA